MAGVVFGRGGVRVVSVVAGGIGGFGGCRIVGVITAILRPMAGFKTAVFTRE
jgi:hypothetical protein